MYIQEKTKLEAYFDEQEKKYLVEAKKILAELINRMNSLDCDCIELRNANGWGWVCDISALKELKEGLEDITWMKFISQEGRTK
jgi:hypothetical protein